MPHQHYSKHKRVNFDAIYSRLSVTYMFLVEQLIISEYAASIGTVSADPYCLCYISFTHTEIFISMT